MNIAIAGYGREGRASYDYFRARGHTVTIFDERDLSGVSLTVPVITGPGVFERIDEVGRFDMVVRTAGLAPSKIHTNAKRWSATNEFFANCPAPIIGVTGTKGKGTTTSFIASLLRAAGRTVHLVGNIGVPALDILGQVRPDDIVVYELSSFQLWDIEYSPQVAVVLMIEPDHLDVHTDFDEYLHAKMNIRRYQNSRDNCWYDPTNNYAKQIAASNPTGRAAPYGQVGVAGSAYVADGSFWVDDRELCSTKAMVLPGQHNLENATAALSAALPFMNDWSRVEAGLRGFSGLPHRLKFVREVRGVRYYDDSIATTAGSAVAAIRAFEEPKIIILGGIDKGGGYESVVEACTGTGARIVAMGPSAKKIIELAEAKGVVAEIAKSSRMSDVVQLADALAQPGDVVILSPAGSSFDSYSNYAERGDAFIEAVSQL